jgi:predicted dehydrogenase
MTASRVGMERVRKMRFYQSNAYVAVDYATKYVAVTSLDPNAESPLAGININRLTPQDIEPLRAETEAFLNAIIENKEPPVTGADGRRALDLALKVLDEIEKHTAKVFRT